MADRELTIQTTFDTSDAEQAVNKLEKSIAKAQSTIAGNNKELERVSETISKLNKQKEESGVLDEKQSQTLDASKKRYDDLLAQNQKLLQDIQKQTQEISVLKEKIDYINQTKLDIAPEMDFRSINSLLDQLKENTDLLKQKETELTQKRKEQLDYLQRQNVALENAKQNNFSEGVIDWLQNNIQKATAEVEHFNVEIEKVRANVDAVEQMFERIGHFPMDIDTKRLERAKEESKQLNDVLKNIQGTAQDITFPQLSFDVDDSKLQSLIAKYNQLAAQYETQSSKVAKLRAQVEELHRVEAEQRANGAVSPTVLSALTEYSNKLSVAEANLDALGLKTADARQAVTDYNAELKRSNSIVNKFSEFAISQFERVKKSIDGIRSHFERVLTRIKNMIFRFVVMRMLYAAFNSLKNIMSAINSENSRLSSSFNTLKSNLLVAFYPVIERLTIALQKMVDWLIKASSWIAGFIHTLTGSDINNSIDQAKKLYDAMNAEENAKRGKAEIDAKIKAKQKEIKALERQAKAIKKEYEAEKKAIDRKKDALDDEIDAVNKTIKALRRQESAEKKAAKALKDSIQDQIDALKEKKNVRKQELDDQRDAISAQLKALDKEIKALEKQKKLREEALKQDDKTLAGFDTLQILSGTEDVDPEIEAIDKQIEALEEKKDALNDVKDAIPDDNDDPLIKQIEAEIDSLEKQKDAIDDVDYSPLIEQQQDIIEKYQEQKKELDKILDKLQDDYNFKINGIDEAKQSIQNTVQDLQTAKSELDNIANTTQKKFTIDIDTSAFEKGAEAANKFSEAINKMRGFAEKVVDVPNKIKQYLVSPIVKFFNDIWEGIKFTLDLIVKASAAFVSGAIKVVSYIIDVLKNLAYSVGSGLLKIFNFVMMIGADLLDGIWNAIKSLFGAIYDTFESLVALLNGDTDAAFEHIKRAGAELVNFLIAITNTLIYLVQDAIKAVLQGIRIVLSPITAFIDAIAEKIGWDNWDSKWFNPDNWDKWNWKGIEYLDLSKIETPAIAKGSALPVNPSLFDPNNGFQIRDEIAELVSWANDNILGSREQANAPLDIQIQFNGTLAQLARVLEPEIKVASQRSSAFNF